MTAALAALRSKLTEVGLATGSIPVSDGTVGIRVPMIWTLDDVEILITVRGGKFHAALFVCGSWEDDIVDSTDPDEVVSQVRIYADGYVV